MRKVRVKKLRKLFNIMNKRRPIKPEYYRAMWRRFKRSYVRNEL